MGSYNSTNVTYTKDQNEKAYPARVKTLESLQHIGYVAIPLGVVSIVVGIVILAYVNRYDFPLATASQIWSGIIIIVYGAVALFVGRSSDNMREDMSLSMRRKFGASNGIASSMYGPGGMAFGSAVAGTVVCAINHCSEPNGLVLAFEALSIAMALLMILLAVYGNVLFNKNRKAFQIFYGKERVSMLIQQMPGQEKTSYGGYEP